MKYSLPFNIWKLHFWPFAQLVKWHAWLLNEIMRQTSPFHETIRVFFSKTFEIFSWIWPFSKQDEMSLNLRMTPFAFNWYSISNLTSFEVLTVKITFWILKWGNETKFFFSMRHWDINEMIWTFWNLGHMKHERCLLFHLQTS